jgi:hypothetical protein
LQRSYEHIPQVSESLKGHSSVVGQYKIIWSPKIQKPLQLSMKYPKLGLLGASFTKIRDEIRSQDENRAQGKRKQGTKIVFTT